MPSDKDYALANASIVQGEREQLNCAPLSAVPTGEPGRKLDGAKDLPFRCGRPALAFSWSQVSVHCDCVKRLLRGDLAATIGTQPFGDSGLGSASHSTPLSHLWFVPPVLHFFCERTVGR